MSRSCSLAIEADQHPQNIPWNAYLVYQNDPATVDLPAELPRKASICDLNSLNNEIEGQTSPVENDNVKHHYRRNSVALKFENPKFID
jgi:hypothetical protein